MILLYNEERKKIFLEELDTKESKRMYLSLFRRSKTYEIGLNKDVYDFSLKECLSLLVEMNPKSIGQVGALKSQFNKYVNWAVSNGVASKNYWVLVPVDDDFAKFAFSSRYIKDINELVDVVEAGLSTPYDKYAIYLLYMGIMGNNFVELSLLRDVDVDRFNRTITTVRRKYTDIIEPLHKLLMSGGGYWSETKLRDESSPYFIKPFKTKGRTGNPISDQYLYRLFNKMHDNLNDHNAKFTKYFTPMTVWRSGMFYALYQIEQKKGSVLLEDYNAVCDVYGSKINYSTFLKDYELYKDVFWNTE